LSNVLFALYHHFGANSAVHVHGFANHLAGRGHQVAVAIPDAEQSGAALGEQKYRVVTFGQVIGDWHASFENAQPPDILHAWTPRENVRLFCEKVRGLCDPAVFVHLEDNEELIVATNLGQPFANLAASDSAKIPGNLSHPRHYKQFLASADGVTLIIDTLAEFVPSGMATTVLWPGADRRLFYPQARSEKLLAELRIPRSNIVLCYSGNVHSANAREVRSLYLAAAMLTREGIPTTLVRAGEDYCNFLGDDDRWAREVSVSLGYVKHLEVPHLLSIADALIQPGTDDEFNRYRLPAKLPEFFAMGKPVVLPATNVGRVARDGVEAIVLPKVDAVAIFDAVKRLRDDPQLAQQLGEAAVRFSTEHFDWTKNGEKLEQFYEEVLARRKSLMAGV
jgi:glycosyltransferase involved in cell wall biosynthesis